MVVMGGLRILGWTFRGELVLFVCFDMQFGSKVFQFQISQNRDGLLAQSERLRIEQFLDPDSKLPIL
jgi:hypothetical protein